MGVKDDVFKRIEYSFIVLMRQIYSRVKLSYQISICVLSPNPKSAGNGLVRALSDIAAWETYGAPEILYLNSDKYLAHPVSI